jgi:hypothetical protein
LLKLVNAEGKAGDSVTAQVNAWITVHMERLSESSLTKMREEETKPGYQNNRNAIRHGVAYSFPSLING